MLQYGKLLAVLLGAMAGEPSDSLDRRIAQYILDHRGDAGAIRMKNIEQACHVGNASISRFCRRIGLRDFFELRQLAAELPLQAEAGAGGTFAQRMAAHRDAVCRSLDQVVASLSEEAVQALCADLHRCTRPAVFGMLKSEAAALVMQSELAALGKTIFTVASQVQQREWLRTASTGDLVLLLSYQGVYFAYQQWEELERLLQKPRVWLITGSADPPPRCVDRVIRFDTDFQQDCHPHQIDFVCGAVVREYARLYGPAG